MVQHSVCIFLKCISSEVTTVDFDSVVVNSIRVNLRVYHGREQGYVETRLCRLDPKGSGSRTLCTSLCRVGVLGTSTQPKTALLLDSELSELLAGFNWESSWPLPYQSQTCCPSPSPHAPPALPYLCPHRLLQPTLIRPAPGTQKPVGLLRLPQGRCTGLLQNPSWVQAHLLGLLHRASVTWVP